MLLEKPLQMHYDSIEDAFPEIDPGIIPFGSRILVQVRVAKKKTAGGIVMPDEVRKTEAANTQVSRVVAMGPLAFKNRNTMEAWPEGAWCNVGDFVRTPKYGGDRWTVVYKEDEEVEFVIFNDLDIVGRVTADPLKIRAFF
jgi:co-chaperonin GroES (HSP10)